MFYPTVASNDTLLARLDVGRRLIAKAMALIARNIADTSARVLPFDGTVRVNIKDYVRMSIRAWRRNEKGSRICLPLYRASSLQQSHLHEVRKMTTPSLSL